MKPSPAIPLPALLELTASQLEVALQNASAQVERLAASVAMFSKVGTEMCAHSDPAIAGYGVRISAEAHRAMFAMQFHDQLVQRLRHIRDALGDMHDAVGSPSTPPASVLLNAIRARYTMEDERHLFDVMLADMPGAPLHDPESEPDQLRSSVELF
jgi:hypothetical protein